MADSSISYQVIDSCGIVSETSRGWTKELNIVSWNGHKPKYDLRDWAPDHEKMGKGITLSEEELRSLGKIIEEEVKRLDSGEVIKPQV